MKNNRAERLNKRAAKCAAIQTVEYLNICDGEVIADIGAGGGLLTFEFAKRTGSNGLVIAADTDSALLEHIEFERARLGIENIRTINIRDVRKLHQYQYDLVFLRDVFHHLKNPIDYFSELRSCLKANGRIAIIDWNKRANFLMRISGHYTPEQTIIETMTASGFTRQATHQHLKGQSFNVFRSDYRGL